MQSLCVRASRGATEAFKQSRSDLLCVAIAPPTPTPRLCWSHSRRRPLPLCTRHNTGVTDRTHSFQRFQNASKLTESWAAMQSVCLKIDRLTLLKEAEGRYYKGTSRRCSWA